MSIPNVPALSGILMVLQVTDIESLGPSLNVLLNG